MVKVNIQNQKYKINPGKASENSDYFRELFAFEEKIQKSSLKYEDDKDYDVNLLTEFTVSEKYITYAMEVIGGESELDYPSMEPGDLLQLYQVYNFFQSQSEISKILNFQGCKNIKSPNHWLNLIYKN